jgi:hypothetical protein
MSVELLGSLDGLTAAQAGNGVSCNVAQWLGESVADALNRTTAASGWVAA